MKTGTFDQDTIRRTVRERYGQVARNETVGCGCSPACCGGERGDGPPALDSVAATAQRLGYSADDIEAVPDGASLGLGCGNPLVIA